MVKRVCSYNTNEHKHSSEGAKKSTSNLFKEDLKSRKERICVLYAL
jgi:hypothetical protein